MAALRYAFLPIVAALTMLASQVCAVCMQCACDMCALYIYTPHTTPLHCTRQTRTLNLFGCAQARTAVVASHAPQRLVAGRPVRRADAFDRGTAAVTATTTATKEKKTVTTTTTAVKEKKTASAAVAAVAAAAARPGTSHPPPRFASLELSVIDPNRDPAGVATTPFAANSREPIAVETDYFSGHALLLLRPDTPADDPRYAAHFEASGPRTMEMQVQGWGLSWRLGLGLRLALSLGLVRVS